MAGFFVRKNMQGKLIIKTSNPYDYNSVVANQMEKKLKYTPSAENMITNPTINMVGKFLGIDATKEWNEYSDKVWDLYSWASISTKSEDTFKIISFLKEKLNEAPSMNGKRINDLFIAYKLDKMKEPEEKTIKRAENPKQNQATEPTVAKTQEVKSVAKPIEETRKVEAPEEISIEPEQNPRYSAFQEVKDLFAFSQELKTVQGMLGGI